MIKMNLENLKEKIEIAKKQSAEESEFKKETFLAVLIAELLQKKESNLQSREVESTVSKSKLKQLSIKEFLLEKKPTNDVERVLSMGFFLEKYGDYTCFNVDDIKNAFVKSKEPLPQNIHDKINMNIRKGHITEYPEEKDNKKSYHLTTTGEKVVEQGFKSDV